MFELSVALKYLTPRWKQLSVSIISLISILVISLVVWLIVVFFSVAYGLEKGWTHKLIAMTAPVRITPTEDYYHSYYYQIDSISANSDYKHKTIREKLVADASDPYDPEMDEEIPAYWPMPERDESNNLLDPVKIAFEEINKLDIDGIKAHDFEMTFTNIRLRMLRDMPGSHEVEGIQNQSFISQSAYLGSFDSENPYLSKALLPLSTADIDNIASMLSVGSDNIQEDNPDAIQKLESRHARRRLKTFFDYVTIKQVKTPDQGWALPYELLPSQCSLEGCAIIADGQVRRIEIPDTTQDLPKENRVTVRIDNKQAFVSASGMTEKPLNVNIPVNLTGGLIMNADIMEDTINQALRIEDIAFNVSGSVQNIPLQGTANYGQLRPAEVALADNTETEQEPMWIYTTKNDQGTTNYVLPSDFEVGDSVLLPKSFRESGVLVGDRGYLSYYTPTASSVQEQRIPIVVAGFYDPGIIPMGGKFILANHEVTSLVRSSHNQQDTMLSNGINVRFNDLDDAENVKNTLIAAFDKKGISPFWKVEMYRDYEFTRDILQQLRSEKNLFSLISLVIIVVACSNIISMLIILVNDKKHEIGILRSMGASSKSIAIIFGTCGVVMGLAGSIFGIILAIFTLYNLDALVGFISRMQGFDLFNPMFYGEKLPAELSWEALVFVMVVTAIVSMIAGVVPAMKACMMKPSAILREE